MPSASAPDAAPRALPGRLREARANDTAVLLISHDLGMVARYCSRIVVMCQGDVVEQGLSEDILARPPAEARLLLGADNYARFRDALQADRNAALAGAEALGKGVPQTLIVKVETAIDAGTPAAAAIDQLKADSATNGNTRPLLDHTANLLRITGGKAGFLKLVKRT